LNRKFAIIASVVLVVLVSVTLFMTFRLPSNPASAREFYVGVEYAYGDQFSQVKALVDKVKDYANLIVLGPPALSFNRTALDMSVDYIYNSGLNFIVLFTSSNMYNQSIGYPENNSIFDWMTNATAKYGSQFLGVYRFDEPGGNQLDNGSSRLVFDNSSYEQVSQEYVGGLSLLINYYLAHGAPKIFTSDYGLEWFDYKANYTAVFGEFVGNESRPRVIAQVRGAAESYGKDWGVIINWKYNQAPYLELGYDMYNDLSMAYSAGAKYAIIFSYGSPNTTDYGTLAPEHFEALQNFWSSIHKYPDSFIPSKAEVAYVIPKDYGFGYRSPADTIWGLFPNDTLSSKIYNDTVFLEKLYDSHINIIYYEPELIEPTLKNYKQIYYWNQTIS
jgi:hypothetical protein